MSDTDNVLPNVVAVRKLLAALTGTTWERIEETARREWPHVPASLAQSYAMEYLRTGVRP